MVARGRYSPEVTHGELEGIDDNDHTQYVNDVSDTTSINMILTGQVISAEVLILDPGTAQGQMLFWDAGNSKWTYAETSELFYDDTNKRIGINDSTPQARLDVKGTVMVTRLLAGGVQP